MNSKEKNVVPQIGKDVIESLTLGMYEDSRFIFREYIQNAADSIDKAKQLSILGEGEDAIEVNINSKERKIIIEDNGTGISNSSVYPILLNIAHSTKKRGENKGFRGIGRLGGLGYCSKLIFETSYKGEPIMSSMIWDSDLLKFIINDRDSIEEAVDVLNRVASTRESPEEEDAHYFRVIMEKVNADELLDSRNVLDYLSMVAPVEIASQFIFKSKIQTFMKENNLNLDVYNIYINGEQIYKPYTSSIYEDNNGGKKKVDDILAVDFLKSNDKDGKLMYWGWYSISRLKGQMKPKNIARGIRLRKENIQIGDEEICKKFFSKTEDQRFSFYYFGEIHAVSNDLIPNSRRDYFSESPICAEFEQLVSHDFCKLKNLCYEAQKVRSSSTEIAKVSEIQSKIQEKEEKGYTSKEEKSELKQQLEKQTTKARLAQKQLETVTKKIEESNSPLKGIIDHLKSDFQQSNVVVEKQEEQGSSKQIGNADNTTYRTDNPVYSKFNKREKKLISKIYVAIANAISDERMREALINNIEEALVK